MPFAQTNHGTLHYDVVDQVAPWRGQQEAILFHHGIGTSAGNQSAQIPALAPIP